jgi:hypothetical protein
VAEVTFDLGLSFQGQKALSEKYLFLPGKLM